MRGRLIVVEGLDGSGKSTLARALAEELGATWLTSPCPELRELRASVDEILDATPRARQLFYAATVMHVSELARPLLAAGTDVVMDRYVLTTLAYAELRGCALDLGDVCSELAVPDSTLFLDCDDEVRARRMAGRGELNDEDERSLTEATRLRAVYTRLLHHHPLAGRVVRLDGAEALDALVQAAVEACEPTQQLLRLGVSLAPP